MTDEHEQEARRLADAVTAARDAVEDATRFRGQLWALAAATAVALSAAGLLLSFNVFSPLAIVLFCAGGFGLLSIPTALESTNPHQRSVRRAERRLRDARLAHDRHFLDGFNP